MYFFRFYGKFDSSGRKYPSIALNEGAAALRPPPSCIYSSPNPEMNVS